jgi:hypothetical protein
MAHLIIRNIGPLKEVKLDLNRINVFIGPQSSGKSTIAKIISFCSWFEKNTILEATLKSNFYKDLLSFHNLEDNYFNNDSYIEYKTDCCHIIFPGKDMDKLSVKVDVNSMHPFKNRKIEYIPAERNFVTLPGIGKYNDSKDNILNFLYDWFLAKQETEESKKYQLPLNSLHASYFYNKDKDEDNISLESGQTIGLRHASSGLMSITPLLLVFDYIMNGVYHKKRIKTPFEIVNTRRMIELNDIATKEEYEELLKGADIISNFYKNNKSSESPMDKINSMEEQLINAIGIYSDYNSSMVIIEEPELNLFPQTQQDLVYYMLKTITSSEREHQLTLTTHSPYILFALNNCVMGGLIGNKIPQVEKVEYHSSSSWIDPKKVSIYEIHDGMIQCIQDEDGILKDNYLNKAYKENSTEYLSLLNYYDNEE